MIVLVTIAAAAAVLLAYEWYAVAMQRLTVTEIVRRATGAYPPLGFLAGLVIGLLAAHFWWQ